MTMTPTVISPKKHDLEKIFAVDINWHELIAEWQIEQQFRFELEAAQNYFGKLRVMARVYEYLATKEGAVTWHIKHIVNLEKLFTPIERNIWDDLRYLGLPLYPQYPALKYMLDFADPFKKICIEADGKEYHQDKARDKKRHLELEANGWTVYHIPGGDTVRWVDEFYRLDEDIENHWGWTYGEYTEQEQSEIDRFKGRIIEGTSGGLIVCIMKHHYGKHTVGMGNRAPDNPEYYLDLNREKFFFI